MQIEKILQRIKKSIMTMILSVVIITGIINLIFVHSEQSNTLEELLQTNLLRNNAIFYSKIDKDIQALEGFVDSILHDKVLIKNFEDRNREALHENAKSYYELLELLNGDVPNMHFYLPDSSSFLRMHRFDKYGDDLSIIRPMVYTVNNSFTTQKGYELGKYGFYLQVVKPIFVNGVHIGAIGVGTKIESILNQLKSFNKANYLIEIVSDCHCLSHAKSITLNEKTIYKELEDTLLLGDIEPALLDKLQFDIPSQYQIVLDNNKELLVNYAMKIKNFEGEIVGSLISIQDISKMYDELKNSIARIVLLSIITIVIMLFVVNRGFENFSRHTTKLYKNYTKLLVKVQTIHMKLNPHFIINSLNSINALIFIDKYRAEKSIVHLAELMRSYLSENDMLHIENELKYTNDYCELFNIRHNGRHHWKISVADEALNNLCIPKFTIQLLVENAFKHGLKTQHTLKLNIKVFRRGDTVILSVSNTSDYVESLNRGLGLKSLKQRIDYNAENKVFWRYKCGVINFKIFLKEASSENFNC